MTIQVKNLGTKLNTVNSLQHLILGKEKVNELVESNTGISPDEMTFNIVSRYRNQKLESTFPLYKRNFTEESLSSSIPRFDSVGSGTITITRDVKGLKFTNNTGSIAFLYYKIPAKFKIPSGLLKIKISGYSAGNIRAGVALIKDNNNYVVFTEFMDTYNKLTLNSKFNNISSETNYANIDPNDGDFYLYMLWGNNIVSGYIQTTAGLAYVGTISISNQSITTESNLNDYFPGFHIYLSAGEYAIIESLDMGYYEGFGHADIKSVTYEDGSPIINNNKMYITASSRFSGINGASGPITIYEIDNNGNIVTPISQITARQSGVLENGTSAKIVYDREEKQWIYSARAFPSPGGKINIGTTKENLLNKGVHIIDVSIATTLADESLDADLIKQNGIWTIGYHGGIPRVLRIATSSDLATWTEIYTGASGEGIAFAKTNGNWYILYAKTQSSMGVRLLSDPGTEIGTITLSPTPGIDGAVGGSPWGTIIPVFDGVKTKFLMVVFTRDEYIEDATNVFSYGDIWSYVAEETETGAEFYIKPQVELGY